MARPRPSLGQSREEDQRGTAEDQSRIPTPHGDSEEHRRHADAEGDVTHSG